MYSLEEKQYQPGKSRARYHGAGAADHINLETSNLATAANILTPATALQKTMARKRIVFDWTPGELTKFKAEFDATLKEALSVEDASKDISARVFNGARSLEACRKKYRTMFGRGGSVQDVSSISCRGHASLEVNADM